MWRGSEGGELISKSREIYCRLFALLELLMSALRDRQNLFFHAGDMDILHAGAVQLLDRDIVLDEDLGLFDAYVDGPDPGVLQNAVCARLVPGETLGAWLHSGVEY